METDCVPAAVYLPVADGVANIFGAIGTLLGAPAVEHN
jgi:hypothetical protein